MKNKLSGRVLWWSERDENGIIVDHFGNEFYFDISVLKTRDNQVVKSDDEVTYKHNSAIRDCLCATNVEIVSKEAS